MQCGHKDATTVVGVVLAALISFPSIGYAASLGNPQPTLGSAASFALLAATTITVGGATTIAGDVGLSPGTSITGMPVGQPNPGTIHVNDAAAAQAQSDLTNAYDYLTGRTCGTTMTGLPLGGATLTPGVYCFGTTAAWAGILRFDALGDTGAVFIIKIGTSLDVTAGATTMLVNQAQSRHIWWQIGSSATVGANADLAGNFLLFTSMSFGAGSTLMGRALARGGAITIDTNQFTSPGDTGTPASSATWGQIKSQYR